VSIHFETEKMCDDDTVLESEDYLTQNSNIRRRDFNKLAVGAAAIMMLPPVVNALDVVGNDVMVNTPDGDSDCYFVHPAKGKHPGVIIWPDILGLRPAFRMMGERLAKSGYSVLVVNPYYRNAKSPVIEVGASFQDTETRNTVMPYYRALSAATNVTDAKAYVTFLDAQKAVDTNRKIGTTGYCMGGPMVMRTAAAIPERIGAGGSFHGGGLVTDQSDSPHLLIKNMKADLLIAVAANDDERAPDDKEVLRKTFAEAGLNAEIEVYTGAMHGWCPPDSRVYHEKQAERAWSRLVHTFDKALV
jgi:carboxymethylenebutenolidase